MKKEYAQSSEGPPLSIHSSMFSCHKRNDQSEMEFSILSSVPEEVRGRSQRAGEQLFLIYCIHASPSSILHFLAPHSLKKKKKKVPLEFQEAAMLLNFITYSVYF